MGLRETIADAFASMKQTQPISEKLFSFGNTILTHRELSAQEAAHITFGFPLVQSSRSVVFINCSPPHKRTKMLKPAQ